MNRLRVAALLREIADELEREDEVIPTKRRAKIAVVPPPGVDELAMKQAEQILKRKGMKR